METSSAFAPAAPTTPPGERSTVTRSVFDAWAAHVVVLAPDGRIELVNAAWERFSRDNGGDPATTGPGVDYLATLARAAEADQNAAIALEGIDEVRSGAALEFTLEYPCHGPDRQHWFRLKVRSMPSADNPRLLIVHEDVTDRTRLRHDVRARSLLLDQVDAAVVATDLTGVIELWNHAAERLFGWSAEDAIGQTVSRLIAREDPAGWGFSGHLTGGGSWEGQLTLPRANGSDFPAQVRTAYVHDEQGEATGIVSVCIDLSMQTAIQDQLARSNRELKAITDSIGDGLCVLDGDGRITYVNPRGQRLMRVYVTEALGVRLAAWMDRETFGGTDGLASTDPDHPVETTLFRSDGTEVPVEYVATPMAATNGEAPTGWVVVFRDISERRAREAQLAQRLEQASWLARIREALDHDGFVLYAQPIIEVASGEVVQNELLLRMRDPDDPDAVLSPGLFLPVAEELGLAPAIDRWVLEHGIGLAATGMPVQINLSATSLNDPGLPNLVETYLTATGADPALVMFEITETALIHSTKNATRFAHHIHELGCKLALDDFGTGYGGFTYLKQLPIDELKIDIEFVRDATTNPASRHVIDAVVSLARAFGLRTVGEGVEDEATLALLEELNVDLAQGYHLGRPGPIDTTRPSEAREGSR
ncbi:MAG: EAL domain-containing protein [Nitriliruptoraceae bacterium]|nr:EAL domain-containing protein [Nitriliruptoraceae bacterium]